MQELSFSDEHFHLPSISPDDTLFPNKFTGGIVMMTQKDQKLLEQYQQNDPELSRLICLLKEEQREAVSMISHEIRNPLTLVNSSLQLIEKAHPEVKSFRFWSQIQEDIRYMRLLLEDLSLFNNASVLTVQKLDLNELAASAAASFRPEFQRQQMKLSFHPCPDLPTVSGDPVKLRALLVNLLKNAMEAMQTGGTAILSLSSDTGCVTVSVKDNGCGISPEQAEEIFLPFKTFKPQGTGLGLALSERIAAAHKGSLTVSSTPGQGSTFTLTLPSDSNEPL